MFDHIVGLLLLGLGINKSIYGPNGNVKGDQTVASQVTTVEQGSAIVSTSAGNVTGVKPLPLKNVFRLMDPQNFYIASRAGTGKRVFNARAFGMGVMSMQENFANAVEASREASKREFEDHKTAFRQQLALMKDAKKQAIVERLNTNCQDINQKRTDKMAAMLAKLSLILTNVTNSAASSSAAGKDTTAVDAAVTSAQTAIADAQATVAVQAGTTCTITISSEANVKTDVGKVVSGLQENLKSVYEKVLVARRAVSDAIRALARVTGEKL